MFPPEILYLIHRQRYQECLQEAAVVRLARAGRHVSAHHVGMRERLFQWIGCQLVFWGGALRRGSVWLSSA